MVFWCFRSSLFAGSDVLAKFGKFPCMFRVSDLGGASEKRENNEESYQEQGTAGRREVLPVLEGY